MFSGFQSFLQAFIYVAYSGRCVYNSNYWSLESHETLILWAKSFADPPHPAKL